MFFTISTEQITPESSLAVHCLSLPQLKISSEITPLERISL